MEWMLCCLTCQEVFFSWLLYDSHLRWAHPQFPESDVGKGDEFVSIALIASDVYFRRLLNR